MPLNVKVALLISISFIAGLCWVVNRAGRTVADESVAATSAAPASESKKRSMPDAPGKSVRTVATPPTSASFARPSPIEAEVAAQRQNSAMMLVASPVSTVSDPPRVALPPLRHSSRAPDADSVGEGSRLIAQSPSPVAVVAPPGDDPAESLATATSESAARRYVVKAGDSLAKIARRELKADDARTVQRLIDANPQLKNRQNVIVAGETIAIPDSGERVGGTVLAATEGTRRAPMLAAETAPRVASAAGAKATAKSSRKSSPRPSAAVAPPEKALERADPAAGAPVERTGDRKSPKRAPTTAPRSTPAPTGKDVARGSAPKRGEAATRAYTIQARDSLKTIAQRELKDERRWREIAALNGLSDPNRVLSGTRLKLPSDRVAQR